jgi:hypothetical protein
VGSSASEVTIRTIKLEFRSVRESRGPLWELRISRVDGENSLVKVVSRIALGAQLVLIAIALIVVVEVRGILVEGSKSNLVGEVSGSERSVV